MHAKKNLNRSKTILMGSCCAVALLTCFICWNGMQYSAAIASYQCAVNEEALQAEFEGGLNDVTLTACYPQELKDLVARKVYEREEAARLEEEARIAAELEAQRLAEEVARAQSYSASSYSNSYTYSGGGSGVLTRSGGVAYGPSGKETWYSERVLPGGGLNIPGRHTDENGLVRDGDGYIVVATPQGNKGAIVETTLGTGKVYDTNAGGDSVDIYTNW